MHLDPMMPVLVAAALVVLVIGTFLRRMGQPHVVVYLIAGVVLGPYGLKVVTELETATRLGSIGVVLLLFFVGMEVSLPRLIENWRVALVGTTVQIALTVGLIYGLGVYLGWPLSRSILLGFIVCLSSTAVVVSMLRDANQLDSEIGRDTLGILLVQDLAIVPMLVVIGVFSESATPSNMTLQVVGAIGITILTGWVLKKGHITLPFAERLRSDSELQIFSAFLLCFGLATITGFFELSTALGAFIAGIVVSSADETEWVHHSLEPLRVLLVGLFFGSVGMLIDLEFLREHALLFAGLVVAVLAANTIVNALILRGFGRTWPSSIVAASMLAQVGEFSFVLAAVGQQGGLISGFGYQLTVGLIALSLLVSPLWIAAAKRATGATT